jgi:hypothetical protein
MNSAEITVESFRKTNHCWINGKFALAGGPWPALDHA